MDGSLPCTTGGLCLHLELERHLLLVSTKDLLWRDRRRGGGDKEREEEEMEMKVETDWINN